MQGSVRGAAGSPGRHKHQLKHRAGDGGHHYQPCPGVILAEEWYNTDSSAKATHPTPLESAVPSGRRSVCLHAPCVVCVFGVMEVDGLISDCNWPPSSWMRRTVEDGSLWNMTDDSMWSWPCKMLHLDLFVISHSVRLSFVAFCSVPLVFFALLSLSESWEFLQIPAEKQSSLPLLIVQSFKMGK